MTASKPVSYIRAWAKQRGLAVGTRGRLHPDIIKAFEARDNKDTVVTPRHHQPADLSVKLTAEDIEAWRFALPSGSRVEQYTCGFCTSGRHFRCPRFVRNGSRCDIRLVMCECFNQEHTSGTD